MAIVGGTDAKVTAVSGHESASMKHMTPKTLTLFRSRMLMLRLSALLTVLQSLFSLDDRSPVLFLSKKPTSCDRMVSNSRLLSRLFKRAICTVNMLPRRPAKIPLSSAAMSKVRLYVLNADSSLSMATASTSSPVKCGMDAAATAYSTRNKNATESSGKSGYDKRSSAQNVPLLSFFRRLRLSAIVESTITPSSSSIPDSSPRWPNRVSARPSRGSVSTPSNGLDDADADAVRSSACASASSLTRISTVTEQKAMSHAHQKMAWSLDES